MSYNFDELLDNFRQDLKTAFFRRLLDHLERDLDSLHLGVKSIQA